VLDVYSGSVHVVDALAYRRRGAAGPRENPRAEVSPPNCSKNTPAEPEGGRGRGRGLPSTTLDDAAKSRAAVLARPLRESHAFDFKNRSTVVKALCLHVAHTCNLNCSYCFAAQGKFHGKAGLMSFETGKQALDFLVIANSGTRRNLEVDFLRRRAAAEF
jgi:uncharacterized protein